MPKSLLKCLLATFALSFGLISIAVADEADDVARVELEIQAIDKAVAIHKRAKDRARIAVNKSSLGRKCFEAMDDAAAKGKSPEQLLLLVERARLYTKQCGNLTARMTEIFLTEEIDKAKLKNLRGLIRELEKLRKDYTQI